MQEYKPVKSGKVREIYDLGDSLIMVASDRISAFDHILKNTITDKGAVLTQMSKFWFDYTKDIIPNHMISVDPADMPEFFQTPEFAGKSMKCRKLNMIPVECIVRGYITGSGWESYKENGTVCGIQMPEGLKECQKLPEPLFTPSTQNWATTMKTSPKNSASLTWKRSSRERVRNTPRPSRMLPSPSIKNVLIMLTREASSSQIPNSNSD